MRILCDLVVKPQIQKDLLYTALQIYDRFIFLDDFFRDFLDLPTSLINFSALTTLLHQWQGQSTDGMHPGINDPSPPGYTLLHQWHGQ